MLRYILEIVLCAALAIGRERKYCERKALALKAHRQSSQTAGVAFWSAALMDVAAAKNQSG
jgi:hypothetical protein